MPINEFYLSVSGHMSNYHEKRNYFFPDMWRSRGKRKKESTKANDEMIDKDRTGDKQMITRACRSGICYARLQLTPIN